MYSSFRYVYLRILTCRSSKRLELTMKLVRYIALLGIVLFQCVLADDSLDADVASANEKVEAAYRLGELYRADTEIGPDLREAALHYYVAANGGHSLAQQKLAKMYYFGNGPRRYSSKTVRSS